MKARIAVCGALLLLAQTATYMLVSNGGLWWHVLLIHPRDPSTLLGVLSAPLFHPTAVSYMYGMLSTTAITVLLTTNPPVARALPVVWLGTGFALWCAGVSTHHYMGPNPVVWGMLGVGACCASTPARAVAVVVAGCVVWLFAPLDGAWGVVIGCLWAARYWMR